MPLFTGNEPGPAVPALSGAAAGALVEARRRIESQELPPKTRQDFTGALNRLLATSSSVPVLSNVWPPSAECVDEIDKWLTEVRQAIPATKTDASRGRAALRAAGVPIRDGRGRPLLDERWTKFLAALDPSFVSALANFPHWCSLLGIGPLEVTADVLAQFEEEFSKGKDTKSARQRFLVIADAWVAAATQAKLLYVPVVDRRYAAHRYRDNGAFSEVFLKSVAEAATNVAPAEGYKSYTDNRRNVVTDSILRMATLGCKQLGIESLSLTDVRVLCDVAFLRAAISRYKSGMDDEQLHAPQAYQMATLAVNIADYHLRWTKLQVEPLSNLAKEHAQEIGSYDIDKLQTLTNFISPAYCRAFRNLPREVFASSGASDRDMLAAMALELGLSFALYPHEIAMSVFLDKVAGPPAHGNQILIYEDQGVGSLVIDIPKTRRGQMRRYPVRGKTLELLGTWRKLTATSTYIFPGRKEPHCKPTTISRAMADLIRQHRQLDVSPSDLPDISAVMVSVLSGNAELGRLHTGRLVRKRDPLLTFIKNMLTTKRTDPVSQKVVGNAD